MGTSRVNVQFFLDRDDAQNEEYLTFNNGPHLCIEIEESSTISCKLPNGRKVSFAFVIDETDFACVDIADDTLDDTDKQVVCCMGRGPTFYSSKDDGVTVTSVSLCRR